MNEDKGKLDYKKEIVDETIRESWITPHGQKVDSVTTFIHQEKRAEALKDMPSSQSGFGNTTGGDIPPINNPTRMIDVPEGYGIKGQISPKQEIGMEHARLPQRMRVGGEELDILLPNTEQSKADRRKL